ncbi:cell division protein ZapE [Rhodococcus phenolicus]|uniref:cell division protein ZapE n=1 Tax=Rhodococcus phenolicus TaxID=263849 RepID=UPI000832C61E|nr:cell division protein ZapE [Rhodococcus phenolicus]
MRWRLRASRPQPALPSGVDVFDTAATELGFTLDTAQRDACAALATDRDLYLWGPVGRGKSWLVSTYFAALPTDRKLRVHFHEFFRDLHLAVRRHRNDLAAALHDLLGGLDVVCFDEFHVHDPADGKFIARLLPALLERDIRVVLTSNYPPHALLPNPLFHDDFVPTIELIERSLRVITVDGPVDYRTTSGHEAGFAAGWWIPPDRIDHLGLQVPAPDEHRTLSPAGHPVHADRALDGCLWIDFADLCEKTTAPVDYLALAEVFPRWTIGNIPDLRSAGREPAQRFANVVDVLYDRDVTTVFLATTPLDALTRGTRLPVDIDRILSRLGQLRRIEHQPGTVRV